MKGVIKMRRPWLLSLVAFSVSPALQAADKSTRIAGFPCEAVRAEIVRRQAVLLARPTEEVSGILAKLVDAPTQYKKLVAQYLGTYKSAFEQVFVSNRLMNRLVQLKKDHAKLKEEAQQAGVLLPDHIAAMVRKGGDRSPAGPKIYGIPIEAMTMDRTLAAKAQDIRDRQWKLEDEYLEGVKEYEKEYGAQQMGSINRLLETRHREVTTYRDEHKARQDRIKEMFNSGYYDHCLGTNRAASYAALRCPAFRISLSDVPGMRIELKYIRKFQLPKRAVAPPIFGSFNVVYDGDRLIKVKLETEKISAEADEWLLILERGHGVFTLFDTARAIFAAPWQPGADAVWDPNMSFNEKMNAGVYGFGKVLTYDIVVATYDSAVRLLERGPHLLDPVEQVQVAIDSLKERAKAYDAYFKSEAHLPDPQKFGETPDGRLEYLRAIQDYRGKIDQELEALKPVNKRIDQTVQDVTDILVVYAAGKGAKSIKQVIKGSAQKRGVQFLEYKKTLRRQTELSHKSRQLLNDPQLARQNPKPVELAKEFEQSKQSLVEIQKTKVRANKEFGETATKVGEKQASTPPDPQKAQAWDALLKELDSDYKPPAHPEGPQTVRTATGKELHLRKQLGGGTVGKVYDAGDGTVVKTFMKTQKPAKVNWERDVKGTKLLEKNGLDVVKIEKTGLLEDGTPYLTKQTIDVGMTLEKLVENPKVGGAGRLPVEYQQALLDLVERTMDKGIFAGDINPGNIVYQKVHGGGVKARYLEGDFVKKWSGGDRSKLLESQINQMVQKDPRGLAKVMDETGGGSSGTLKNVLDPDLVTKFREKYKAKLAEREGAANHARLSDQLGQAEVRRRPPAKPTPEAQNAEAAKFDLMKDFGESSEGFGLRTGDLPTIKWDDLLTDAQKNAGQPPLPKIEVPKD